MLPGFVYRVMLKQIRTTKLLSKALVNIVICLRFLKTCGEVSFKLSEGVVCKVVVEMQRIQ
jgi:hypothetical protein